MIKRTKLTTMADFRALVAKREAKQAQLDADYQDYMNAPTASRFAVCSDADVLDMWGRDINEHGRPLSDYEGASLLEAWVERFDCLPPGLTSRSRAQVQGTGVEPPSPPSPAARLEDVPTDTMLSTREVVRLAGVSASWLYRAVRRNRFPPQYKLPTGRKGWKAIDVQEWLRGLQVDPRELADRRRLPNVKR